MHFVTTVISYLLLVATTTQADDSDWSVQWYTGEPYQLTCDVGNNVTTKTVRWDTPTKKNLKWPLQNDADFQIMDIGSANLLIKSIRPELHGVYICTVYDVINMTELDRQIYGINIHEEKYRNLIDKYKHNLTVAGTATALFLALMILIGGVVNFRYVSDDEKRKHEERKRAQLNMYNGSSSKNSAAFANEAFDDSTKL